MDVVRFNEYIYLVAATVSKEYNLFLWIRRNPANSIHQMTSKMITLIHGDSDTDGEPDLYEILGETDPNDSLDYPWVKHTDFPFITPIQTTVIQNDETSIPIVFVSFSWTYLASSSRILKFVGNYDTGIYELDRDWHDNGILRISRWEDPFYGYMDAYSDSQIVIANSTDRLTLLSIESNAQTVIPVDVVTNDKYCVSVGQDDPSDSKYFYISLDDRIIKLNENGNVIHSWRATSCTVNWLTAFDLYADKKGNVFVTDLGLGTINHFDSQGQFISRWYENNHSTDFQRRFNFADGQGFYGQASIAGDGESFIYIIDQTPLFFGLWNY
jgi:hypothetical protein